LTNHTIDPLPQHVGIIMDGNGRWANQKAFPRIQGHTNATKAVREAVEGAAEFGIKALTLFAFSTENWKRPKAEVSGLMQLFEKYLKDELPGLMKNGIKLITIGNRDRLPKKVLVPLDRCIEETKNNSGMTLCLAVDYGARDELVQATRSLVKQALAGQLKPDQIDEARVEKELFTAGLPELDLIIRTSGELRLSNFLLWQAAYAEFYFTPVLWPDFNRAELEKALIDFSKRSRRVGAVYG